MSSPYEERLKCLRKLESENQGLSKKRSLEKEINNRKEGIQFWENAIKHRWIREGDYVNTIQTAEDKISKIKTDSAEKLKKDLSVENKKLDEAKKLLKESNKRYKDFKKSVHESKKIIKSNTKKIKKIEKLREKCYKTQRKRENAEKNKKRCPNGTRKNKKSGKCEKK